MTFLTLADLVSALQEVGVSQGSNVMLHSSLQDIGKLGDVPVKEHPERIVDAILELIGLTGTLCVPAPNWDYGSKRIPFDIRRSPVSRELGVLSNYVISRDDRKRSPNPIFSIASVGRRSMEICNGGVGTAFGIDSPWDRMFKMNFDNVFLGCDLTYLSFTRYIEHHFGVPYLYNKLFDTPVLDDGKPLDLAITAPLRFMECPAIYDLSKFEDRLRQSGYLQETKLGSTTVKRVPMNTCFAEGISCLKEDIHFFLKTPPPYRTGHIPVA